ncbi:MAG: TetR/AcrR family transcriptional regulator [Acidimicrobiales bacterium]
MRRTATEAEKTRRAIVAVARRLFAAHGYAGTSTMAVVDEAGVTRGALYHHFDDKTALFRAVFVELEHELNDSVATTALAEDKPLDAFMAGCGALLDFVTRPDYHQIALVDAPAVLGSDAWHEIDAAIGLASMQAGLDALDHAGYLRVAATPALAVLLFGALTEAGLVLSRDGADAPARQDLLDTFMCLVTHHAPPGGSDASTAP